MRCSKLARNVAATGKQIKNPCPDCHGNGVKDKSRTLEVSIPAGVDDGDRVRLAGEGEAGGAGVQNGDLYVEVRVKAHNVFTRQGADLYMDVPVSITDAALGKEVEIPTLDGKVKIKVAEGTQSGKLLRVRGKGVTPVRTTMKGDLICPRKCEAFGVKLMRAVVGRHSIRRCYKVR